MELVSMVIKVKYGERVRRFTVHDCLKVLTIVGLKEKIISLFGLKVVAKQLQLTYIDEDGDVIDLDDADDLHEAVINQGLNPLLITVAQLLPVPKKSASIDFTSTISSTAQEVIDFFDYYAKQCFALQEQLECDIQSDQKNLVNTQKRDEVRKVNSLSKLDSCWVEDVTVTDGITMAPSTPFTKIWRLRNTGVAEWPHKTEIIWMGGDRLSTQSSFEVQNIPVSGLPVDSEVDIAVDLVCPEIPGDYVAFWRLASPTGERFGQHIKVVIEVEEPSEKASSIEEPFEKPKIIEDINVNVNDELDQNLSTVCSGPVAKIIEGGGENINVNVNELDQNSSPECSEPVPAAASRNWFTDVEPYPVSTINDVMEAYEWLRNWEKTWNPLEGADDDDDILMNKLMPKKDRINKNKILRKNKNKMWK